MKSKSKIVRPAAAVCVLALLLPLGACSKAREKREAQLFAMDTVMLLTAYGENAEAGLAAAKQAISGLDAMLDPEDGTLGDLNRSAGTPAAVSPEIAEILETCSLAYERSGGAFDPSVYPLVKAWGFINGEYRVPARSEIDALLGDLDFGGVALEYGESGAGVTLPADTQISFAAVAKGYASARAVEAMREAGVESAVVSLGGNVQTLGAARPDGKSWTVAIQDPNDTGTYAGTLSVGETAVITSGGYQRFFEESGVTYHHILDPATGRPSESGLVSVTIVCPDGAMADALSTALFVLGEEKAIDYYNTWGGFELVLITADGRALISPGLKDAYTPAGDRYETVYF